MYIRAQWTSSLHGVSKEHRTKKLHVTNRPLETERLCVIRFSHLTSWPIETRRQHVTNISHWTNWPLETKRLSVTNTSHWTSWPIETRSLCVSNISHWTSWPPEAKRRTVTNISHATSSRLRVISRAHRSRSTPGGHPRSSRLSPAAQQATFVSRQASQVLTSHRLSQVQ